MQRTAGTEAGQKRKQSKKCRSLTVLDDEEVGSVDCTVAHSRQQKPGYRILKRGFPSQHPKAGKQTGCGQTQTDNKHHAAGGEGTGAGSEGVAGCVGRVSCLSYFPFQVPKESSQ